ncbi:AraC-like DNA-binding protein [Kordia periserrulae]|uniref:AraC-like DNA-binding protein n=1 Tax=Kordia periserrulae TaxID=701523 RepID=A0A2T6BW99_9FLAO|nr:helix-turn-helix domain-containing protein [Kordia periserrulae]PTX60360.1 AraC-like DNA-binding protein [Kordia periserrulae]
MKCIANHLVIICVLLLSLSVAYGSERVVNFKNIQELSASKSSNQIDSITLMQQQEKLIKTLIAKQEAFELKYYLLIGIILFLVLLFGLLCFFNKRGNQRLHKIMRLLENSKPTRTNDTDTNTSNEFAIDPAIVNTILENLNAFEKELGFLNPKITLHTFAKKLQTNTKYLSKVINTHKLKSFRNYINDLRIQYSIEELKKNVNFRKYTVKAMAKETGFSNRESFTKAFQKNTGTTVSEFVKHIST